MRSQQRPQLTLGEGLRQGQGIRGTERGRKGVQKVGGGALGGPLHSTGIPVGASAESCHGGRGNTGGTTLRPEGTARHSPITRHNSSKQRASNRFSLP